MTTTPPNPVYFVIVITPLFVVNVNCACTKQGKTSNNAKIVSSGLTIYCPEAVL